MQPPVFCTGSRNTAATVSGPSNSIASAMRSAAHCPNVLIVGSARAQARGRSSCWAPGSAPGVSGSNGVLSAGTPVMASAPRWCRGRRRACDHLVLPGLPASLKYCLASFHADSTASAPPVVKNTRFRSPGRSRRSGRPVRSPAGARTTTSGSRPACSACRAAASASSAPPVSDLHGEQTGQPVEIAVAGIVEDRHTVAAGDDGRGDARAVLGEVQPEVVGHVARCRAKRFISADSASACSSAGASPGSVMRARKARPIVTSWSGRYSTVMPSPARTSPGDSTRK